jgi:hypothetical protein
VVSRRLRPSGCTRAGGAGPVSSGRATAVGQIVFNAAVEEAPMNACARRSNSDRFDH